MKKITFNFLVITICGLTLFGLLIAFNRINMIQHGVFDGFFNQRYLGLKTEMLIHVGLGLLYFVLAPVLIMNRVRNQSIKVHRFLGKVCLVAGVILGVASCVIHYRMVDGLLLGLNGWFSSLFFLLALSLAFYHVRQRNLLQHRAWMIRAYSIAMGAFVVVRVLSLITFSAFTSIDLLATDLVITSADKISLIQAILFLSSWAGTLVPLLVGELIIKGNAKMRMEPAKRQVEHNAKSESVVLIGT